jgi:hypothetical protein
MTGSDGKKKRVPYEVGPDTLYAFSEPDISQPIDNPVPAG